MFLKVLVLVISLAPVEALQRLEEKQLLRQRSSRIKREKLNGRRIWFCDSQRERHRQPPLGVRLRPPSPATLGFACRSCLDDDEAFLTTADSAIRLLSKATRTVSEWKGLEYRAAFPILKPAGANFYPLTWTKWHSEFILDSGLSNDKVASSKDLYIVPYSQEYKSLLAKSAKLLHKAGDITNSTSLKKLLHSKADAFLSNDYYESDIAWMELDSKLDITIGPYETYEDKLFGYK
ncbi:hypothetical protein RYX36_033802, partial [Vicia faba]